MSADRSWLSSLLSTPRSYAYHVKLVFDRRLGDYGLQDSQLNGRRHTDLVDHKMGLDDAFERMYEERHSTSQGNPIRAIWRRLWLIALIVFVLVGAAVAFSYWQTPAYRASIKVLIGHEELSSSGAAPNLQSEVMGLENITKTMAQAINSQPVAQEVKDRLSLPISPGALREDLKAKQIADTQFIEVSYEDPSPENAQLVANTVGEAFSDQVTDIRPAANSIITATVWEQATRPGKPVSPDMTRNVLLALALGLMLGVALALLLDYLKQDDRSGLRRLEGQGPANPEREENPQSERTAGGAHSSGSP